MTAHGGWTTHAKQQAFLAVTPGATAPTPPTSYYAALFSNNANPAGGTCTEVSVSGYARQAAPMTVDSGGEFMVNTADISWAGMAGATVAGFQIVDAASGGTAWYWWNFATPQVLPSGIVILAGQLELQIEDLP